MIVLGVESSCDETSVSIVKDTTILSNIVLSQIDVHSVYGGVVPEIASREHVKGVTTVFESALIEADVTASDIDLVCVTEGPGLIGSLLIGINAAKAYAFANEIPIMGVHHIAGHIYANEIENDFIFPLIALVVSGGHTELILMDKHYSFKKLGETLDDAVGECYDKVARVLGLPYPGGPVIDKLAKTGKDTYKMPRIFLDKDKFDFSFSGLKSHVLNLVHNAEQRNEDIIVEDVCCSFQNCVVDVLVAKAKHACNMYNAKQLIVAGGVAANSGLKERLLNTVTECPVLIPNMQYCTDNAAMIAVAGYYKSKYTDFDSDLELNGKSRMDLCT